jgi:hypothetical protein
MFGERIFQLKDYFLLLIFAFVISSLSCVAMNKTMNEKLVRPCIPKNTVVVVDSISIIDGRHPGTYYIINEVQVELNRLYLSYLGSQFDYHFFRYFSKIEDNEKYLYRLAFKKDEVTVFNELPMNEKYIHSSYRQLTVLDDKKYILGTDFYIQISGKSLIRGDSLFLEYAREWIANQN